jgi:hypothetical protein
MSSKNAHPDIDRYFNEYLTSFYHLDAKQWPLISFALDFRHIFAIYSNKFAASKQVDGANQVMLILLSLQ